MRTPIFYGNAAVIITNEKSEDENDGKSLFLKSYNNDDYLNAIKRLKEGHFEHVIIHTDHIDSIIDQIKSQYQVIEAAGGIITNKNNETLMIFRRGKWDLPKGKIEPAESIERAAEREIEEETGVRNLTLRSKLKETYHIYKEKQIEILKISYWCHFSIDEMPILIPQTEEDITAIKWFSKAALSIPLGNTYGSIKYLFGDWLVG